MKMIFSGKIKRLMGVYIMFQKVIEKNYRSEWKAGTVKYYWNHSDDSLDGPDENVTVVIETTDKAFAAQMRSDFAGISGRVKRASMRVSGVKVELIE